MSKYICPDVIFRTFVISSLQNRVQASPFFLRYLIWLWGIRWYLWLRYIRLLSKVLLTSSFWTFISKTRSRFLWHQRSWFLVDHLSKSCWVWRYRSGSQERLLSRDLVLRYNTSEFAKSTLLEGLLIGMALLCVFAPYLMRVQGCYRPSTVSKLSMGVMLLNF